MRVLMVPRWLKCSLARIGAVKVGLAVCPFNVCTIHRLQSQPVQESGPLEGFGATPGVPYHAMSTRPSSPATAQANTLLWSVPTGEPDVSTWIGAAHVLPSSVENEYSSTVSPVTWPLSLIGACSHTA